MINNKINKMKIRKFKTNSNNNNYYSKVINKNLYFFKIIKQQHKLSNNAHNKIYKIILIHTNINYNNNNNNSNNNTNKANKYIYNNQIN
jgi:hypothetical protein